MIPLAVTDLRRLRPTFADAVPLVLFTVLFLGNAVLGYISLRNITSVQERMMQTSPVVATMDSRERDLLEASLAVAEERRVDSFVLILTANFVGLGLVLLSLLAVRKAIRKEQKYLEELMEAKESLEYKVGERTAALQHFSNELKRSNRELQDFAFVASHDLQEPLRKIRAFGDRLQLAFAEKLGDQGADYIKRMQMASERMSRLINDLLSFSRITSKAKPFLPVALKTVVDEVVEDLEVAIEEAGATLTIGNLPEIEADVFQMKQLFQNLIGNAIKFRRPGVTPLIAITADAWDDDDPTVTIRVFDNGIGFDEMFLDRIFLPFQRLHSRSEYSGTGIGLAICRRVAERHGGSLIATSAPDVGSTFIVTLARANQVYQFEETAA